MAEEGTSVPVTQQSVVEEKKTEQTQVDATSEPHLEPSEACLKPPEECIEPPEENTGPQDDPAEVPPCQTVPQITNPESSSQISNTHVVFTPSPNLVPQRHNIFVEPNPPNIFGQIPEHCVTFCVDTSGSMFRCLDTVKEHLIEALKNISVRDDHTMFNLIEFNSRVTQWADRLVKCTPETVEVAKHWINNLTAKTGTNTQDALLSALADPSCEAIYLVSDCLPDQYPDDVLDRVVTACGRRSIHCIYMSGERADEATVEFLEDLAVETFGSLHIVSLTTHGCVERVTPVYRSDHAHERIVHTVSNTLRPNIKTCSVARTLNSDPADVFYADRQIAAMGYPPHLHPYMGGFPHRYYYPHYWSRYRPAKAWLSGQGDAGDMTLSPAAASLLVGKKVIARRTEDGYFYKATVQSQVLDEKFLVAFGPCKHGKYKQTVYQDTYVFDIVDYYDALRHTIITGDQVLAPWEPEGERFAPGIVLEGHEKRQAEGPDDKTLTVTFSNGQTEKVPAHCAVWIPGALYERLSLELQMPKAARETLLKDADNYPLENLPGYPESGPLADPINYPRIDPFLVEPNPYVWDPYLYRCPPYLPYGNPGFVITRRPGRPESKEVETTQEPESVIPGTGMTRKELDERVMSQLKEHCKGANEEKTKETEAAKASTESTQSSSRLLERRDKREENLLKKSVTFSDQDTYEDISSRDISLDDSAYDDYGNPTKLVDSGVNTDSSLLFYRSPGVRHRQPWNKYWGSDPSPPVAFMSCSTRGGGQRATSPGPFRETALQAPLEARDMRDPPYDLEWASPAFKYVDSFAKHDYSSSVEECLGATPYPPPGRKPARMPSYTVASRPVSLMSPEEREEARRAFRRRRVLAREEAWQNRLAEEDGMKALMQDQHRERIIQQMERDRQRQLQEQRDIQQAREGKKRISRELRARIEKNQMEEEQKENMRIEGLRRRRERREDIQAQREKEIESTVKRREEIRKQNNESRLRSWTEKLDEQETQSAAVLKQHQDAKLRRQHHFRELERRGQEQKDLRLAVKENNQAIFRSQIFA